MQDTGDRTDANSGEGADAATDTATDEHPREDRRRGWFRRWTLWAIPRRTIVYVLSVDALAVFVVVGAVLATWRESQPWGVAAVLTGAALGHMTLSWEVEKKRRDQGGEPHVELLSVWVLAAALTLTAALTTLLIVVIHGYRWWLIVRWDPRRRLHRHVFNTAMATVAALTVTGVSSLLDVPKLIGAHAELMRGSLLPTLVALAVTYWVINTLLFGGVILSTTTRERTLSAILGTRFDNLVEAGQLVLGVCTALLVVTWSEVAVIMVGPVLCLHYCVLARQFELAARTDSKTGLINAKEFERQLAEGLVRALQAGKPVSLLLLDLDHFKEINDRHGHLFGDDVLRSMGRLALGAVRQGDPVGRWGGEEFVVMLPGANRGDAVAVAERLRQRTTDPTYMIKLPDAGQDEAGTDLSGVTISIGVACSSGEGTPTARSLLTAADEAMYAAKARGRNEVVLNDNGHMIPTVHSSEHEHAGEHTGGVVDGPAA